jgi:hypothetical protein
MIKTQGLNHQKIITLKKYIYILADVTCDKNTGFEAPKNNNTKKNIFLLT